MMFPYRLCFLGDAFHWALQLLSTACCGSPRGHKTDNDIMTEFITIKTDQ